MDANPPLHEGPEDTMITGIHAMFYTKRAEEMREFLRDVLGLKWVDAGGGWPIFAAPPTDLAVHETEEDSGHELYLICDDIADVTAKLEKHGITATPVSDRGWGLATELRLPSGDIVGIYEPRHPRPHKATKRRKATRAKSKAKTKAKARPRAKARRRR